MSSFLEEEFRRYLADHRHPLNRATHFVGIPIIVLTPVVAALTLDWRWLVGGQVVGWTFQLLGHRFEGNKPSFLSRPVSLLMGPLMVLVEMLGLVGVHLRFAEAARAQVQGDRLR